MGKFGSTRNKRKMSSLVLLVNLLGALVYGYNIGFVGVYTVYNNINLECSKYTAQVSCEGAKFANCVWLHSATTQSGVCVYSDYQQVNCSAIGNSSSQCASWDSCSYNYKDSACQHTVGWNAFDTGIFAGSMILGAFVGSFCAGAVLKTLLFRKTFLVLFVMLIVSSALMHVSQGINSFWLLVVSRFLIGIPCGMITVVCPKYVTDASPPEYREQFGIAFQVFLTFGIFLAGLLGLLMEPHDYSVSLRMSLRTQLFIGGSTFLSLLMLPLYWMDEIMNETESAGSAKTTPNKTEAESWQLRAASSPEDAEGLQSFASPLSASSSAPPSPLSWCDLTKPLLTGLFLSMALQLTGINAFMNYAPTITQSIGMAPLLGNCVVMLWNFITTIVAVPASRYFTLRQLFLLGVTGLFIASVLTGIAVFPGVIGSETVKQALAGVGIIVFIAVFEIGVGPPYFVLALSVFPSHFAARGASATLAISFLFNLIINMFFPVAVQALSGGSSGNQDQGMAIVFLIFAAFGGLSLVVLLKTLHPYEDSNKRVAPSNYRALED